MESDSNPTPAPTPEPTLSQTARLNRAFGPVIAGLIIDFVDLSTFGPIGLYLGLPIGGAAGYWMGQSLGLSKKTSLLCALVAGIYCMFPGSEVLPIATIVGALARYYDSSPKHSSKNEEPPPPDGDGSVS